MFLLGLYCLQKHESLKIYNIYISQVEIKLKRAGVVEPGQIN